MSAVAEQNRKILLAYIERIRRVQQASGKALGVVLAGHNGSGKSTLWYERLGDTFEIPLINADRMMMSILPEIGKHEVLPTWAAAIRDSDESWMTVAQKGVENFVAHAMSQNVPFARETVFSYWRLNSDGTVASKIDQIREMQTAGYFVVLIFVGLSDWSLSAARVATRVANGGHAVGMDKLRSRFERTQQAIRAAAEVCDATVMLDNSRTEQQAFTVCRVQLKDRVEFDVREGQDVPTVISQWLDKVSPK